jgi:hypothetical protein
LCTWCCFVYLVLFCVLGVVLQTILDVLDR